MGHFCRWTSTASVGSLCVLLIHGHFRASALCCSYVNFIGALLVWEPRHSPCHKFQLLCTVFGSGKGLEVFCFYGSLCLVYDLWLRIFLVAAQEPAAEPSGSVFLDHLSVGPFWWAVLQNELRIRMVPCTVTAFPLPVLDCCFHECTCLPALPSLWPSPPSCAWAGPKSQLQVHGRALTAALCKWLIRWHKRHLKGHKMFVDNINQSARVHIRRLLSEKLISPSLSISTRNRKRVIKEGSTETLFQSSSM